MTMTALQALAFSKAVSEATATRARDEVAPGLHIVEPFTVEIGGELMIAEDTEKTPTSSTPWLVVIALALKRSGVQADSTLQAILEAVEEANVLGKDAREKLLDDPKVAAIQEKVKAGYKTLAKTKVRGTVKPNIKASLK